MLIDHLPNRKERRKLSSAKAFNIVQLRSPKFATALSTLQSRWAQPMCEALFADEVVNKMLTDLEDDLIVLCGSKESRRSVYLWSGEGSGSVLPLPIMGLEFTLLYYFPTTFISLSSLAYLNLDSWSLTGTTLKKISLI